MGVFDDAKPTFSDLSADDFMGDLGDAVDPNAEPVEPQVDTPPPVDTPPKTDHKNILDEPVAPPEMPGSGRKSKREKALSETYAMIGLGVYTFDAHIGATIMQQAEQCASSLDDLAKQNPSVARALDGLLATSAWSAVIAAHLPIVTMVATKYVPAIRERYTAAAGEPNAA